MARLMLAFGSVLVATVALFAIGDAGLARSVPVKASDVFFDCHQDLAPKCDPSDGREGKPIESVVSRDVVVGGWIQSVPSVRKTCGPDPGAGRRAQCEDLTFDVRLDPDFTIAANANTAARLATIKGNPDEGAPIPFADEAPPGGPGTSERPCWERTAPGDACASRGITLNSFTDVGLVPTYFAADAANRCSTQPDPFECLREELGLPMTLHVELNAYNEDARPEHTCAQLGWVTPTAGELHASSNDDGTGPLARPLDWSPSTVGPCFAFNPSTLDSKPIVVGQYIVLRGTIWEDVSHFGPGTEACVKFGGAVLIGWIACLFGHPHESPDYEEHSCWGKANFFTHSGWLEMHPPDSMQRAKRPTDSPLKTVATVTFCVPVAAFDITGSRDIKIYPRDPVSSAPIARPDPACRLSQTEDIDGRFSDMRNVDQKQLVLADEPNGYLSVHLQVHSSGTLSFQGREGRFKATYTVWWSCPRYTVWLREKNLPRQATQAAFFDGSKVRLPRAIPVLAGDVHTYRFPRYVRDPANPHISYETTLAPRTFKISRNVTVVAIYRRVRR